MTFTSPLDLTTMLGDVPVGATVIDSTGTRWLKIRVNGWNTAFPVQKMVFVPKEKVTFSYKYDKDTSAFTASSVQAFFQFMKAGATYEDIPVTDNPASTKVKSLTTTLKADTINQLQVAAQNNSSWSNADAGPIFYISQMSFAMPVTTITIAGGTAISDNGGKLQLTVTVAPTNAAIKTVTWSVSDTTIAKIDATGKLTAISNGSVVVTATAKDGSGVKGTATITISGQVSVATTSVANIVAYPNPVTDMLYLKNASDVKSIEVININGSVIYELKNTNANNISTSELMNGMYFLRVKTGNGVAVMRFIKK